MIKTMHIRPAPDLKIRLPDRPQEFLPEKGAQVPASAFWLRRVNDGSVLRIVRIAAKQGGHNP